jgi:hypothetical protein
LSFFYYKLGQHYWDGKSEVAKNEMTSTKHLSIDVHDPSACFIIRELLSKTILNRMTLQNFMVIVQINFNLVILIVKVLINYYYIDNNHHITPENQVSKINE